MAGREVERGVARGVGSQPKAPVREFGGRSEVLTGANRGLKGGGIHKGLRSLLRRGAWRQEHSDKANYPRGNDLRGDGVVSNLSI
jgi:hypothetical protein